MSCSFFLLLCLQNFCHFYVFPLDFLFVGFLLYLSFEPPKRINIIYTLRSYILFVLDTPDVKGTTQAAVESSSMGVSPSPLLYGPTANYGSIIIPCNRHRLFVCRQITKCRCFSLLSFRKILARPLYGSDYR